MLVDCCVNTSLGGVLLALTVYGCENCGRDSELHCSERLRQNIVAEIPSSIARRFTLAGGHVNEWRPGRENGILTLRILQ